MTVKRDIDIALTAEEIMRAVSHGRRDAAWMAEPARAALNRASDLLAPVIVFEWVGVETVSGEAVRVRTRKRAGTAVLTVGPQAKLLTPAVEALVSVNSIGAALDDEVRRLNDNGEMLAGYLLDCVGVVALSKVADEAARMAEKRAQEKGWGVGARLSPGSLVGWDTSRQKEICGILPLEDAGIGLTESGLLVPFKSASGMVGIGPGYPGRKVGSVCSLCKLKDTCWRRKT
ncbi:MAG: hypothetical protein ACOWWM_20125 [Desulfobacterales bacterium]|jgi:hypothetical protein